ncbi:MAG TPA: helix-turn-helix domain-containing protein [Clostridia bacterium]
MNEEVIPLKDIAQKLSPMCWEILNMLSDNDSLTYTEIKAKFGISQEKISKEISRLEGALLIEFTRDYKDERTKKFRITNYGSNIMRHK